MPYYFSRYSNVHINVNLSPNKLFLYLNASEVSTHFFTFVRDLWRAIQDLYFYNNFSLFIFVNIFNTERSIYFLNNEFACTVSSNYLKDINHFMQVPVAERGYQFLALCLKSCLVGKKTKKFHIILYGCFESTPPTQEDIPVKDTQKRTSFCIGYFCIGHIEEDTAYGVGYI
jgi:hypothetical protein